MITAKRIKMIVEAVSTVTGFTPAEIQATKGRQTLKDARYLLSMILTEEGLKQRQIFEVITAPAFKVTHARTKFRDYITNNTNFKKQYLKVIEIITKDEI